MRQASGTGVSLRTIQVAALVAALSIVCLGAFAAGAPAISFAPEQILPLHHVVPVDGLQVAPAGDKGGEHGPWVFATPFGAAHHSPRPERAPSYRTEPRDAGWREIFLVRRYNTKYK